MMPEQNYFLHKANLFFLGTFELMVSGCILMEPNGLTKVIHVTKLEQLL